MKAVAVVTKYNEVVVVVVKYLWEYGMENTGFDYKK